MENGKALRGISRNQICVGIACDAANTYCGVEGLGETIRQQYIDGFPSSYTAGGTSGSHFWFMTWKKVTMPWFGNSVSSAKLISPFS